MSVCAIVMLNTVVFSNVFSQAQIHEEPWVSLPSKLEAGFGGAKSQQIHLGLGIYTNETGYLGEEAADAGLFKILKPQSHFVHMEFRESEHELFCV